MLVNKVLFYFFSNLPHRFNWIGCVHYWILYCLSRHIKLQSIMCLKDCLGEESSQISVSFNYVQSNYDKWLLRERNVNLVLYKRT